VIPEVLEATEWGGPLNAPRQTEGQPTLHARTARNPLGWTEVRGPGLTDGAKVCPDCAELVSGELAALLGHVRDLVRRERHRS
jgi:hypothetical protein